MIRACLILVCVCATIACASTPLPQASAAVDWSAVADEGVPEIVTIDADGDVRETKLWLVVMDGAGYVRTGKSRWNANLERDPNLTLRIGGAAHAMRATPVQDSALRGRLHEAFRSKYGFSDRMAGWVTDRPNAKLWRLDPR